jgi:hypothetical protein
MMMIMGRALGTMAPVVGCPLAGSQRWQASTGCMRLEGRAPVAGNHKMLEEKKVELDGGEQDLTPEMITTS